MIYDFISIHDLPLYPEVHVSKKLMESIERDGLIEPILWDGEHIHPFYRERWMAFYTLYGDHEFDTVMLADIRRMSKEDLASVGIW